MTRVIPTQHGAARPQEAESARWAAAGLVQQPSIQQPGIRPEMAERGGDRLLPSALRLGLVLLMLPLGLALATGGAWQTVLWMGALLLCLGARVAYEDASERRRVETPERLVQQPQPVNPSLN